MNNLPSSLRQIALFLERLPGIGQKTANRLALFFLKLPKEDLAAFAQSIRDLKEKTKYCKICLNLTEEEVCMICSDNRRDTSIITVVEDPLDLLSFEAGDIYQGVYHVLHGKIDPLNNVSPDDIYIEKLIERVSAPDSKATEVILATNLDMEGEATALYIKNKLLTLPNKLKVTRLAYGLPMGASLEYADYMTLKRSIDGRAEYK